jgi:arylsulfatase A-like enzyme
VAKEWQGKSAITHPYADFVMQTDSVIGRVLDTIQKAGISENTLVVLTSDNGCAPYIGVNELEAKGHYPSANLRGYKASAWEGGHRVPFIVRWPGQVKPGSTCSQTICSVDLLATFAELLGEKLPANAGEDSISLMPLLKGNEKPIHEAVIHHSSTGIFAVRSGKWKLILGPGNGASDGTRPHLYDLETDLGESKNLAETHPETVQKLTQFLERFIAEGRSTPGEKQNNDVKIVIEKPVAKKKK